MTNINTQLKPTYKEPTEIEQVVYNMLTETTGVNICDSGGAYGRNHERNAKKALQDFRDEPSATLEITALIK